MLTSFLFNDESTLGCLGCASNTIRGLGYIRLYVAFIARPFLHFYTVVSFDLRPFPHLPELTWQFCEKKCSQDHDSMVMARLLITFQDSLQQNYQKSFKRHARSRKATQFESLPPFMRTNMSFLHSWEFASWGFSQSFTPWEADKVGPAKPLGLNQLVKSKVFDLREAAKAQGCGSKPIGCLFGDDSKLL